MELWALAVMLDGESEGSYALGTWKVVLEAQHRRPNAYPRAPHHARSDRGNGEFHPLTNRLARAK